MAKYDELPVYKASYDLLLAIFQFTKKQVKATYQAGEHQIEWSGDAEHGNALSKGLYHVRMVAGDRSLSTKVVMMK